jgi:hypothetical protein
MKNIKIKLMSVKEDGLPEPDMNKMYFVIYNSGCAHGSFHQEYTTNGYGDMENGMYHYKNIPTGRTRWFLDFDGVGHENEIESYFELPESLWE